MHVSKKESNKIHEKMLSGVPYQSAATMLFTERYSTEYNTQYIQSINFSYFGNRHYDAIGGNTKDWFENVPETSIN